jgi:hypothetical protein
MLYGLILILFLLLLGMIIASLSPNSDLSPVIKWLGDYRNVAGAGLLLAALLGACIHLLPGAYEARPSQEQLWRKSYDKDFHVADRVLSIFCGAFMFDEDNRFKFAPKDRLMDIYRSIYPIPYISADSMEFEHFITCLEEEFGITIADSDVDDEKLSTLDDYIQLVISSRLSA